MPKTNNEIREETWKKNFDNSKVNMSSLYGSQIDKDVSDDIKFRDFIHAGDDYPTLKDKLSLWEIWEGEEKQYVRFRPYHMNPTISKFD